MKEILNIAEAAELLGVTEKTFRKVLKHEIVPGRKIGREWKFSRQALIEWVGRGRSSDFRGLRVSYPAVTRTKNGMWI